MLPLVWADKQPGAAPEWGVDGLGADQNPIIHDGELYNLVFNELGF